MSSWIVSQLKYSSEMENMLARIFLDGKLTWTLGNVLFIEQVPEKDVPVSPNTTTSVTPYWPGKPLQL